MNPNLVIFLNALILIALMIGLPTIFVGIISLIKVQINKVAKVFLYSFASGLIIILGSVGFLGEAIENLNSHFSSVNNIVSDVAATFIKIGVIAGGAILGAIFLIGIRLISLRKNVEIHQHHNNHCHNDHITNYSDIDSIKANKTVAIILLMSHRILDGLSLGFIASGNTASIAQFESWGMVITFIIHLVPMSIVIYFTQYEINKSRLKSFGYSILMLLITSPFVIIGAYLAYYIDIASKLYWLMPFLFSVSGVIMVIIAIIELLPEFIHNKEMSTKQWYCSLLLLIAGIILGLLLLCIHSHSHAEHPTPQIINWQIK